MRRSLSSGAFVGRGAQLAALEAALNRALERDPRAVLVAGEAGVGKTRLVSEFAGRAEARGARVVAGGCVAATGTAAPLLPVVEALRRAAEQIGWADWLHVVGEARPALARVMPELGAAAEERDTALAQSRLFELLLGVLRRVADRTPLVWVVEDVHWADPSTLDLLAFAVRNLREDRVLVVATFRDEEADRVRRWLAAVGRDADRVAVAPFARAELDALLAGILGAAPQRELADRIFERSEGNAFIAEELLAGAAEGELPATLRDVLLARLAALDEPSRRLVRVAATIGRRVDHRLLAAVADVPEERLLEGLREAVGHHLLVAGDGAYGFRHELMREAAAGELLPRERERLHARVAETLTERPELGGGSGEIAHHWRAAGDAPRALACAVRAGDEAARAHAFADALVLYEQALAVWDEVPAPGLERSAVLERAAEAAGLAGRHGRAIELIDAALDGDADRGRMLSRKGWQLWLNARGGEALRVMQEAVRLLPSESTDHAEALSRLARWEVLRGRRDDGRRHAERALGAARGVRALESELLNTLGLAAAGDGDEPRSVALLRESLAAAENAGDPERLAIAYGNLSSILGSYGRFEEAVAVALEGAEASRRLGVWVSQGVYCTCNAAENLVDLGRLDEADRLITAALAYDVGRLQAATLHIVGAELCATRGDLEAAERHIESARLAASDFAFEHRGLLARTAAAVALQRRRPREAHAICVEALELAAGIGDEMVGAMLLSAGLRAVAALPRRAARDAEALEAAWSRLQSGLDPERRRSPEVDAHVATAAAERSRLEGASDPEPWAAAQAAWDALAMPHPATYTRLRRAETLLPAREPAAALLAEARAACVAMGARPLRSEIEALARRARIALPGAAPARDEALGLTPRELDVLGLLAEGRTNRQIAEALFISVKTAGVHVSNILRKLDASTRGEAAATGRRAGLV